MRVTQLNHVALHVDDVGKSEKFYAEVLGLDRMPRPAFTFPGAWFRIGVDQELHLIGRDPQSDVPPRERHFALMVQSIEEAEQRLLAKGWSYREPKRRPDGATQIFLQDPDGHWIELCTPPAGSAET